MLFNQISFQNKFVLFVDYYGMEKWTENTIKSILSQQNNLLKAKFINSNELTVDNLKDVQSEIIVLPLVSDILIRKQPQFLFSLINNIKRNKAIKQMYLWVTKRSIEQVFIIKFLEYMADEIITIKNSETLSILIRKTGGLVSNKHFNYKITLNGFEIEPLKTSKLNLNESDNKSQNLGTFKIELEEEELVARNALILPFEKAKGNEGNIVYTPDNADDFDDEDPDEDLSI